MILSTDKISFKDHPVLTNYSSVKPGKNIFLYDACIAIDSTQGNAYLSNSEDISNVLGVGPRSLERYICKLKKIGIGVNSTRIYSKGNITWYKYSLVDHLNITLTKLDKYFGFPRYSKPSSLTMNKQKMILQDYSDILSGKSKWQDSYFNDEILMVEKLRVIIPFCLEKILQKEVEDVDKFDLGKAKLTPIIYNHFHGRVHSFLKTSYLWLKRDSLKIYKRKPHLQLTF